MVKNVQILVSLIDTKLERISFQELLKLCVLSPDLPHSKGEIYFLVSTLKALGILEDTKEDDYKINWVEFEKLKEDGLI